MARYRNSFPRIVSFLFDDRVKTAKAADLGSMSDEPGYLFDKHDNVFKEGVARVKDAFDDACARACQGDEVEPGPGYWKAIHALEQHPTTTIEKGILESLLAATPNAIAAACTVLRDVPLVPGLERALEQAARAPSNGARRVPIAALRSCLPSAGYDLQKGAIAFVKESKVPRKELLAFLQAGQGKVREFSAIIRQLQELDDTIDRPVEERVQAVKKGVSRRPRVVKSIPMPTADVQLARPAAPRTPEPPKGVEPAPQPRSDVPPRQPPRKPPGLTPLVQFEQESGIKDWFGIIVPSWRRSNAYKALPKSALKFRERGVAIVAGAYFRQFQELPASWQWERLEATLLRVLPRESDAKIYFLRAIGRIMKEFCHFLAVDTRDTKFEAFAGKIEAIKDLIFCNSWMLD
jgi:hypothetical protein